MWSIKIKNAPHKNFYLRSNSQGLSYQKFRVWDEKSITLNLKRYKYIFVEGTDGVIIIDTLESCEVARFVLLNFILF